MCVCVCVQQLASVCKINSSHCSFTISVASIVLKFKAHVMFFPIGQSEIVLPHIISECNAHFFTPLGCLKDALLVTRIIFGHLRICKNRDCICTVFVLFPANRRRAFD